MAEATIQLSGTKAEQYEQLLPIIQSLADGEEDVIANLANVSAALKQGFGFFWVGFYLVKADELVLGPFQGPIACTRIKKGRGVCGTAWQEKSAILVPNVDEFPGHIACSSASKSEIVVPLIKNNTVIGVLDVDSDRLNDFDETDMLFLTQLCTWLSGIL
ncbi:GAF domain-containing protein [Crocinitomicaceae bacterium CZZ-1]|uniref:GAF domain-containing protein n=1 Tax=Taishania pollutisoli TaxID=2766479 RepID=A0A8J6PIC4_9FLAO|nr:GAF domain-containing protein [Taishania pollutisoli]MBC9812156.1 GAF domain-containing protein [Taishania pollutisoli]